MNFENILNRSILDSAVTAKIWPYWQRCRPRILIVTDGGLGFNTGGFGLSRFIEAIAHHPSVTLAPILTLAHRGLNSQNSLTVGTTNYVVKQNFKFDTANPAVTIANYDQIWIFGIDGGVSISTAEITAIATFMNAGGGVFATGDHAALGRAMSGNLPRIRHMRNWNSVPMGLEALPLARERIDTIVNPGDNNRYQFIDQSDNIPQRIYPNYAVTGPGFGTWSASIHPVLRLPGAAGIRSVIPIPTVGVGSGFFADANNLGGSSNLFSLDIDVLPDHPHESECFEVSATVDPAKLNGSYSIGNNISFPEFPSASGGGPKIGSSIVAYSVSGGRTVHNGGWKPPVRPRMFGANSAFDGHLADPLVAGAARPGRIMCDATWHHFVNVNLDGTGSGRTGLGTIVGAAFVPSADLLKIYNYFQNMVSWLQPSNRIFCKIWWILDRIRFHPEIFEELLDIDLIKTPEALENIGAGVARFIDLALGQGTAADQVVAMLRANKEADDLAKRLIPLTNGDLGYDLDQLVSFSFGRAMAYVVETLPKPGDGQFDKFYNSERSHDQHESGLAKALLTGLNEGLSYQAEQLDRKVKAMKRVLQPKK